MSLCSYFFTDTVLWFLHEVRRPQTTKLNELNLSLKYSFFVDYSQVIDQNAFDQSNYGILWSAIFSEGIRGASITRSNIWDGASCQKKSWTIFAIGVWLGSEYVSRNWWIGLAARILIDIQERKNTTFSEQMSQEFLMISHLRNFSLIFNQGWLEIWGTKSPSF